MDVEERAARPVCRARGTLTRRATSICVSRREPSSSRAVEKAFCMRFCFAVCPSSPPHLRCFRANGSEVDSPR